MGAFERYRESKGLSTEGLDSTLRERFSGALEDSKKSETRLAAEQGLRVLLKQYELPQSGKTVGVNQAIRAMEADGLYRFDHLAGMDHLAFQGAFSLPGGGGFSVVAVFIRTDAPLDEEGKDGE